jgi:AcrR family transcriptional regulator
MRGPSTTATLTARRAATRRAIIDAAEGLFADFGYSEVSPADVSAMVGIGRTTFYEYFDDMEHLLAELVELRLPEVTEQILSTIPRHLSHREQLSELALRTVEYAVDDHVFGLALHQGLPALSAGTTERIVAAHRTLSAEFGRVYAEGVAAGEFREMPGDLAAALLADAIMATAKTLLATPEPKARFHEVGEEFLRFLFHGLDPSARPGGG